MKAIKGHHNKLRYLSFKVLFVVLWFVVSTLEAHADILQINSLSEVSKDQPTGTVYFLDIDDTVIDYPYMLGSKAWRAYIIKMTKRYKNPGSQHDAFTLFLAENHAVKTVEPITKAWVEGLYAKGYAVYGLTARERNVWYYTPRKGVDELTISQLAHVKIDFDKNKESTLHSHFTKISEYYKGVFFCNLDSKGDYLKKIFRKIKLYPKKVVFVDDNREHVERVAKVLSELKIEHECYWYCALDEKNNTFDPAIANIQFYYFRLFHNAILSDEEAEQLIKLHPEKDPYYYLNAVQEALAESQ